MVILYSILFFVYSNFIVLQNLFLLTRNKNQRSKLNFSLIGLKYKFKSVLFLEDIMVLVIFPNLLWQITVCKLFYVYMTKFMDSDLEQ